MDFKSLLSQLDQLNEAEGKVHKGTYGTSHGKEDVRDQYGHKIGKMDKEAKDEKDAPKKGRGRPKKGADETGEVKKYDFSAFGVTKGKDVKLPKHDKKKTTKHSLKEYFDALDKAMMNEAEQIQIKPASQMPKQPGQTSMGQKPAVPGQPQQVAGQPQKNTQVIAQGNKTLGTVDNPQLAQQIKQSIGKGEMTLMPNGQMDEDFGATAAIAGGAALGSALGAVKGRYGDLKQRERGATAYTPQSEIDKPRTTVQRLRAAAGIPSKNDPNVKTNEEDIGKHNNATTGFDALVKKLTPKYGVEAAKRIAGAQLKKIREADQPPNDSLMSPISEARTKADDKAEKAGKKVTKDLEYDMGHKGKDDNKAEKAGKKVTKDIEYDEKKKVKEAKKPDANKNGIPDYAEDGKGKNDLKKKKVKEGMEHKLKAARHTGKAHALAQESYNCKYDDMEEARHYHEGYKEGLDECYGQMPIQGYVGEANKEVADMASYGAHTPTMEDELDEVSRGDWLKQQASKPGDTFKAFGQTFHDKDVLEDSPFFESLEQQLNALLEDKVDEGMTVSISKGQQGQPDSVSVSAQDGEADQLLSLIKSAGLGLFGGDEQPASAGSHPMSVAVDGGEAPADIEVVDDHDDMLSLIRKMTGQGPATQDGDYEEEGGEPAHSHEEDETEESTCETCGESACGCEEAIEEDETTDQREYEVAEDAAQNDGEAETSADENAEAAEDQALATVDAAQDANQVDEEEKVEESYANGDDDTFETDIDFMTNIISGGLNKRKATGQTTQPVIAGQTDRMGYNTNESVNDWKKLAGIK